MSEEERIQNLVDTAHYYQCRYSDEVNHRLDLQQRIQQLAEALKETEKQRDDFFYWAEELAAHGFNCTYGHEEPSKFIPLAREYWSEMQDDIAALASLREPSAEATRSEKEGEDGSKL